MKRHLKNDKFQLTDLERENLWHGIRGDLKAAGESDQPDSARTSFKPDFGVAAAVALVVVVGSWWVGTGRLGQNDIVGGTPPWPSGRKRRLRPVRST